MDARGTSFIQGSFTDSCLYGQLSLNQVKNSMAERLKQIRERSKLRRQILAQQLGAGDSADIGKLLGNKNEELKIVQAVKETDETPHDVEEPPSKRQAVATSASELPGIFTGPVKVLPTDGSAKKVNLDKEEEEEKDDSYYEEYDLVEETLYKDSSHFLKGTQSANPHNDYCQHLVDTGQRPHNFIRDCGLADRFEEYPKLKELIRLKDEIIAKRATPPMYLKCDPEVFDLHELDCKFDVILIDPPLEEYQRRAPGCNFNWNPWTWDEISKLEVEAVAAQRSFLFMWCGSHEGLDQGRMCMRKWGFRRCEDICWIKTNKNNPGNTKYLEPNSVLQHTKEHCLMGIKGTVRRSTDGDFIHANVDIDLIITEEPALGSTEKPTEIFHIIEHFCLGRRRLHLFGSDNTLRPGWLTVGSELSSSNFSSDVYKSHFSSSPDDYLVGSTPEIEQLRPKSPVAKHKGDRGRGGGPSRGGRGGNIGRGDGVPRGGLRGGPGMGGRGGMMRGMRGFPPR